MAITQNDERDVRDGDEEEDRDGDGDGDVKPPSETATTAKKRR